MIVCLCTNTPGSAVESAIKEGARSVDAVRSKTGAGSDCGGCRVQIHSILDDAGISCASQGGCSDCPKRHKSVTSAPQQGKSREAA